MKKSEQRDRLRWAQLWLCQTVQFFLKQHLSNNGS